MDILYSDSDILVCLKPPGVLSTDEPGGLPELVRRELGQPSADVRTVHRLDRVVGGLMVLARNAAAASDLSAQLREGLFKKEYAAVVHGDPGAGGRLRDLLYRDKARKMTFVTQTPGKGVQEALLEYQRLWHIDGLSRLRVLLHTGRTHQIRCQFASRGFPLAGERKYSTLEDDCPLALFSAKLSFNHPQSGETLSFTAEPESGWPWNITEANG